VLQKVGVSIEKVDMNGYNCSVAFGTVVGFLAFGILIASACLFEALQY
jgi:hypothetical protein